MTPGRATASTRAAPEPTVALGEEQLKSTHERILDVALDLFLEKGYDKTSLREIAEQLGFSKAALYYHFASKDDIFMALHNRLHRLADGSLAALGEATLTVEDWVRVLDGFIDVIPGNRTLLAMFERNRAVFESLHIEGHAREHEDLDERLRSAIADPSIPVDQRVRMAFAFSGVMGALLFAGDSFLGLSSDALVREMKARVHEALGVGGADD
jgi:AcrR family transcriptional regulator